MSKNHKDRLAYREILNNSRYFDMYDPLVDLFWDRGWIEELVLALEKTKPRNDSIQNSHTYFAIRMITDKYSKNPRLNDEGMAVIWGKLNEIAIINNYNYFYSKILYNLAEEDKDYKISEIDRIIESIPKDRVIFVKEQFNNLPPLDRDITENIEIIKAKLLAREIKNEVNDGLGVKKCPKI